MALYETLKSPKEEASRLRVPLAASNTVEDGLKKEVDADVAVSSWHGVLYGFKPTLAYLLVILAVLIALNVLWACAGTLGFAQLNPLAAVSASNLLPGAQWLLASRAICTLATVVPLVRAVIGFRHRQQANKQPLVLGGLEILLIFCTLWTWCCKAFYFVLATIASALYVCLGFVPGSIVTSSLWILFDISFGMTWLVFWACWLILIPTAHLTGHKAIVAELLKPTVLYVHNANVVIMLVELLFSAWTVNLEHCIFPVYFGIAYVFFNWWLHSKIHKWIYFFLNYDWPYSVPVCLGLVVVILASFWSGAHVAQILGKA